MTFLNEADWDRGARIIGGLVLLALGWAFSVGTWSLVLFVVGGISLATGLVGWCPLYSVFGISTVKAARHRPTDAEQRHA